MNNQTGRAENLKLYEYVDPYRNQRVNQGITPGVPPQNYPPQTSTYYNQGYGGGNGNNKGGKGPIIGIIILSILLIGCIVVICLFVSGKFQRDTPTTESTTEITTEAVTENINPITAATTTESFQELTETTESTETSEPADIYDNYIGSDSMGYVGKPSYYETLKVPYLSNGVEEAVQAYDSNVNIYDDAESNVITLMLYNKEYSDMDAMTAAFELSLQDQGTVTKQNTTISGYDAVWFRVAVKDTTKILDMYLFKNESDNQMRVLSIEYTPDNEFITDYKDTYTEKLYAPSNAY